MFENARYNTLTISLLEIFTVICLTVATLDEETKISYLIPFVPGMLFVVCFPYVFGRHIPKLVRGIIVKRKLNEKFKQIFDKLDETIIILNKDDNSISYVNDYFYLWFKDILIKMPDQDKPEKKHALFLDLKIFKEFKSSENQNLSLNHISKLESNTLK